MAGASPEHALLTANVTRALSLGPGCRAFSSDLFVLVGEDEFHPDVTIICGPPARDGIAATNPAILVEVTSPSTERYDRDVKVPIYQTIPSLRAILLVSQERQEVTVFTRRSGWIESKPRSVIDLDVCQLEVAAIYNGWERLGEP